MTFQEESRALLGQYNNNIAKLTDDSTVEIFSIAFKQQTWQLSSTNINKIRKGCFYIVEYDYNGNKIWSPILILEYKVKHNKNIVYGIDFNYLPYKYRVIFLNKILTANKTTVEKNDDIQDVKSESSLDLKLESVYNWLKANGKKEYSLTAFDVLKMKRIYAVSTTLLYKYAFLDTKYINKGVMLETLESIDDIDAKEKMKNIIDRYEELLKMYDEDIELFYKALRNFESNLKLFDE